MSCIINLFAGSIYAWSVFASPLAERIGSLLQTSLTSADLAIAFSIANALGPIPMIFGGLINDRFGPKFVIAAAVFRWVSGCMPPETRKACQS